MADTSPESITRGLYDLTGLEGVAWRPLVSTVAGLAEFSRAEIRQRFSDDLPPRIRAQAIGPGASQESYFDSILAPCIDAASGWGLFLWLDWIYRYATSATSRSALRASVNQIESIVKEFRLLDFVPTPMSYTEQCEAVQKLAAQTGEDRERIHEAFYEVCKGITPEEQRARDALGKILSRSDTGTPADLWPSPSRAAIHALNNFGLSDATQRFAAILKWLQDRVPIRPVPYFLVFTVEQTGVGGVESFTYSSYRVPGDAPCERDLTETYLIESNSGTWEGFRNFVSGIVGLTARELPSENRKNLRIEFFLKDSLLDQFPELFLGGNPPKLLAAEYCVALRPWQRGTDPINLQRLEERYRAISVADGAPPRRVRILSDIPESKGDLLPDGDKAELVFFKKRPKTWQLPPLMDLIHEAGLPYVVWPHFELGEEPLEQIFPRLFKAPRVHSFCEALRDIRKTYGPSDYKVTMIADSPYRWPHTGQADAEVSFALPY